MEEKRGTRGGKREGAGRRPDPNSKVQISVKLDKDLNEAFSSENFKKTQQNKNNYINEAIRAKMKKDGIIN